MDHTHCQATRILQRVHYNGFSVVLADMHVRRFVKYYIKRDIKTELILDHVRVELPEVHYDTRGIYYEFDGSLFPTLTTGTDRNANVLPAFQVVHAAEHTILGLVPLHTSCARSDIMGQGCDVSIFDNIRPTISIFETTAGCSGISEILLEKAVDLLRNAAEAVEVCPCEQGCAMCVCSIACAIHNEELNKAGCAAFLRHIVNLNTIPSPQAAQTAPLS
jgi:DEAD/DEAH box helicase domain-containing protein